MANYLDEAGLQALRTRLEAVYRRKDASISVGISDVTGLQTALDDKVPTTRTVNGKALSSDIALTASDVGAITPLIKTVTTTANSNGTLPAMSIGELKFYKHTSSGSIYLTFPSGGKYYVYSNSKDTLGEFSGGITTYNTLYMALILRTS